MKSLLTEASLILLPNGYKEGKLYSTVPSNGAGDFTVARATTATRVNSAGLVELVPYNFVQYSNTFNNGVWVTGGYGNLPTLTANSIQNPVNGLTDAWLASFSASGTQGRLLQLFSGLSVGVPYTYSMYVKSGTKTSVTIYSDTASVGYNAVYNLSNGTITSVSGVTATITEVSNGWYFLTLTNNILPTGLGQYGIVTNTGEDGTLYIYGAQLNIGSTAKSYYPTTTRLNIPRLDYTNGSCPSILVEPQRTNVLTYSNEFSNAAWSKNTGAILANNATSLEGITNASKLVGVALTTQQWTYRLNAPIVSGSQYTFSIFAKKGEYNFIQLRNLNNIDANTVFDLNTGTVYITSTGTAKIENYGNGWYRCSVTATATGTGNSHIYVNLSTDGTGQQSFLGNGTSGVFIYGAQHEIGSYATSYIPTTSASVTRNADVISKTGISSLIGQTEGTIFMDFTLLPNNSNNSYLFSISDGSSNNIIRTEIYVDSPSIYQFRTGIATLGVSQGDAFTNITQPNNKMAISYKLNEVKIFLNGVLVATDTSVTIPATSQVHIGNRNNTDLFIGSYYKSFVLFPTALTNAQLELLTGTSFNTYAEMASYYNYTLQ